MRSKILVFIFLTFLAGSLFVRFWRFGEIPPGLNRDEASVGYTAYSLLKTGTDEYGRQWPLSIQSFGDWKLPFYIYADIPLVAAFGLQDWVVRLPSALAGLGTILVIFFLAKELQINPFLAALGLATLPWHLHFSRMWHEANTALFFLSLGVLFFLKGLKKAKFLPLAAIFLALPLYIYHTHHIFIPLFLGLIIVLFRSELRKNLKISLFSLGIFLFLAGIIYSQTLSGNLTKSSISFLNDRVFIHGQIELPRLQAGNSFLAKIIYNRPVVFTKNFVANYFKSFGYRFMAISGGDHPIHNLPGTGNIFWFEYPLFFAGLYFLWRKRDRGAILLLLWLAISPIGSSLTKDAPNSGRLTPMILPLVLIIAFGAEKIFAIFKKNCQKNILLLAGTLLLAQGLFGFADLYFREFPALRAKYWGAGYQKLTELISEPRNQNKAILMPRPDYSPYIHFLFYSAYDPKQFQKEVVRYSPTDDGFYHVKSFGRFKFGDFDLEKELNQNQLLVLWTDQVTEEQLTAFGPQLSSIISEYDQPLFYVFEGKRQPLATNK